MIVRGSISQYSFPEAPESFLGFLNHRKEELLYSRKRPGPIDREVKARQYQQVLRKPIVKKIPAPVHVRRGVRAGQRQNRLLRYQNTGKDHGGNPRKESG